MQSLGAIERRSVLRTLCRAHSQLDISQPMHSVLCWFIRWPKHTILAEPLFSLANHFEVDADTLSAYLSLLNVARSPCGKINLEAPFKPDHNMKAQVKRISFNKLIIGHS